MEIIKIEAVVWCYAIIRATAGRVRCMTLLVPVVDLVVVGGGLGLFDCAKGARVVDVCMRARDALREWEAR